MQNAYKNIFQELYNQLCSVATSDLENIRAYVTDVRTSKNKVLMAGNGGSHAIASHLSVDMTKICNVTAISFSDPSLITCLSNDFAYDVALQKFIEFYHQEGDLVILISSSGKSQNIINAATKAKDLGLKLITLSGFSSDNPLKQLGDVNVHIPINHYNIVENCHQILLTTVMDLMAGNSVNHKEV